MNWRLLSWRDIIAFAVVIVGLAALFLYAFPRPNNFGFGPEWDCRPVPKGEPICIKKSAPR